MIVRVITQDIPYDVQQLCAEEEEEDGRGGEGGGYEALMDLLLTRGMDTYVEEKEETLFGFATGALGSNGGRGLAQREHLFTTPQLESPLETLVKAVIRVCGKYEDLVLDRLLQESHHDNGFMNLDSRLSTKLKRYRQHSPTLSLKAQAEVCQHVLQLCEDRLCQLRSGPQCCSLLVHTRGGGVRASVHSSNGAGAGAGAVVQTPFEFVVVRPTGLGVVVSTALVVQAKQQRIPNYAEEQQQGVNEISSFVPFSFTPEGRLTEQQRLVSLVSGEMARQPDAFALLDTVLLRYVADVSFFNVKPSQFHCVDRGEGGTDLGEDMNDDTDGNVPETCSSQTLSAAVQHLFTQSIGLSEECLDNMLDCLQNATSIPWSMGNDQEIVEAGDTLFGDLLSMPSLAAQEDEERHPSSVQSQNPMCSFAGAELLYDLSAMTTRSAYLYYQAVACVFLGLSQRCQGLAGPYASLCVLLRDKYLPLSLTIVTHYSFVNWTGSVHLSASRQLEKQVDFRDLVYDSALVNSLKSSLAGYDSVSASPFDSSEGTSNNNSVLLSFWQQFSSRLSFVSGFTPRTNSFWRSLGQRCLFAMRPSTHSDYSSYLIDVGQYSLATKSSSLSLMREVPVVSVDVFASTTLLQYFFDNHSLAVQRITGVQMYLHDITTAVRGSHGPSPRTVSLSDTVTLDPSNMVEIKKAVYLLVQLVDLPSSFTEQFSIHVNEWSCGGQSRISYNAGRGDYALEHNLYSTADIENAVKEWTRRCQEQMFTGSNSYGNAAAAEEESLSVYALQERDEGWLCLSEALLKLATTPYFRVFYSAIALMLQESQGHIALDVETEVDVINIILQCYPDLLLQLHLVSLAMTAHHLVDRARALLPLHFGVEMALHSGRAAVGVLEHVINNFTDMFNAWNMPSSQASEDTSCRLVDAALHVIRKELEGVLSSLYANILDISLLSCLFDEGYAAVMQLVVLFHQSAAREHFWIQKNTTFELEEGEQEEQKMEEEEEEEGTMVAGGDGALALQWRSCLRSLMVKACSCGQLQWVCDRQDVERLSIVALVYDEEGRVVQYTDEKVVDVVKEIVQQFEFVCNSSDFTDYFSGNTASSAAMVEGAGAGVDNMSGNSLHLLALYDCLAAFLLNKGLRQECARVMYQLVWRLEGELSRGAESNDEDFAPLRILDPQAR